MDPRSIVNESSPQPEVPGYEILRLLGEGGMAQVYLAREMASGREVALKITHPHLAKEPDFVTRFLQEVKATHGLGHENIVASLGYGESRGRYWLAAEFVPGGSLQRLLENTGKLPAPIAIALATQMLRGLGHAHERGIVHRDVKPANLLLRVTGVLKVCDFGIARSAGNLALTQTGNLIGTPAYMSPEQASGQPLDPRSDLFSAGIVLYECLTGTNPFRSDNQSTTILRIIQESARAAFEVDPTIPPAVERVLDRLLERDPDRRYASAAEALADLTPIADEDAQRYPGLVAEYLTNPPGVAAHLAKEQAVRWQREALEMAKAGPARRQQASMLLYRAALLDPSNPEVLAQLKELCAAAGVRFGTAQNPKIAELERALEAKPDAPGILQQLAQLHRMEGNLYQAIVYLKRYLRVRPNDSYAANQLSMLTGENPRNIASLVAGIKTGGFKASAPPTTGAPTTASKGTEPTAVALAPAAVRSSSPQRPGQATRPLDYLRAFWGGGAGKIVVAALLFWVVVAVIRRAGRAIDAATVEVEVTSSAMSEQADVREQAAIDRDVARGVEDRRAGYDAAAAAKLEAATASYRAGNHLAAADAFARFVIDHPNRREESARARFLQGKSLIALNRHAEAESVLSTYLETSPESADRPEALLRRGQSRAATGRYPDAAQDFTLFLAEHGGSVYAAEALVSRGEAFAASAEGERAGSRNGDQARIDRASAAADFRNALARLGPADPLYGRATRGLQAIGEAASTSGEPSGTVPP